MVNQLPLYFHLNQWSLFLNAVSVQPQVLGTINLNVWEPVHVVPVPRCVLDLSRSVFRSTHTLQCRIRLVGLEFGMMPRHVHILWHLTPLVPYISQLFLTVRLNPQLLVRSYLHSWRSSRAASCNMLKCLVSIHS